MCQKIGQREEAWRKDQVAAVETAQVESLAFLQIGPVAAVRIGQVESIALAG